ncbi:MAG: FliH/SctL family protein [Terriglobales bacterium]
MSYSGAAAAPAPEQVSEFVYQVPASEGASENERSPADKSKEIENSPRVSEKELSRIVAEARAEGFREGQNEAHKKFEADLTAHMKLVSEAIASFEQEREKYFLNVEGQLVHLALAIAGKILHREAQVDRMVVAGLVKVTLERMQQTTKAIIRIRPEDALSWRHYFNTSPDLEIIEDPTLEPNACRIETELGVAEMGLDAQLKEVENGFFDLLAQRPGAQ